MIRAACIAAGLAGLIAFPAFAHPALSEPSPVAPDAAADADADADDFDPEKVICRKAAPPTGTRVRTGRSRQQICMTAADWEQVWAEAEAAARDQDNPHHNKEFLDNPQ